MLKPDKDIMWGEKRKGKEDLNPLKSVEVCFMDQRTASFDKYTVCNQNFKTVFWGHLGGSVS